MSLDRRSLIQSSTLALGGLSLGSVSAENPAMGALPSLPQPARIERILFSCKFGMSRGSKEIEARFAAVKNAGYDGIDFDDCGKYTVDQVRQAAYNTGLFVHNAINHTHWRRRFTSKNQSDVDVATKNLEHCMRVSHAVGGSAVLLVVGRSNDGSKAEVEARARDNISKLLPLAGALGQRILIENVWNGMSYVDNGPANQGPEELIKFIDSFKSPWIGSYFDVGNHHRYGDMGAWIRGLGHRVVKLDLKGYHKAKALETKKKGQFKDITHGDINWADIRVALKEINFHGWTTAEVGGGDEKRLKLVLEHMKKALLG